jgi:hypothetical protein
MPKRGPHKNNVTIIRYSCLTGKAVWVYTGSSRGSAYTEYWLACKEEIERMVHWNDLVERRKANIMRMLNDLTASVSIGTEMSPSRKEAAQQLVSLAKEKVTCYRDFYEHVMEERRRREETREFRRRERNEQNTNYDK